MTTGSRLERSSTTVFLLGFASVALATLWMVAGSAGLVLISPLQLVIVGATGTVVAAITVWCCRTHSLPLWWIVSSAALLRLVCVVGQPLFEDDHFRYLWDGMQLVSTGDPFTLPPSAWFGVDGLSGRWQEILSRINYPDIATVYGPVLQWLFGLGYLVAPGNLWPLQLMAALADVLIIVMLITAVRHSAPGFTNAILLYAWSPLLLKEFALSAHPDVYAVLLVLVALRCGMAGKAALAGIVCGLAVGIKIFALIALPFLLAGHSLKVRPAGNAIRIILGCGLTLGMITLGYGEVTIWFPDGLQAMATDWLFNAPLYLLLQPLLGLHGIRLLLSGLFAVIAVVTWIHMVWHDDHDPAPLLAILFALLLLALPVLNPWYLIWVLAFAVWQPWRWPWVASVAILLSYWSGIGSGVAADALYQLPGWVLAAEFVSIGLAVCADLIWPGRHAPAVPPGH